MANLFSLYVFEWDKLHWSDYVCTGNSRRSLT